MPEINQSETGLAGPQDLIDVFESRIKHGGELHGSELGVELWAPSLSRLRPEHQTFYVASRTEDTVMSEYTWREVMPGVATSRKRFIFDGPKVYRAERANVMWYVADEEITLLSPEEVHLQYCEIGNPQLAPREDAIRQFYAARNAGRLALVRPFFRMPVLGADRPPKHF